jgi:hypothetical protein
MLITRLVCTHAPLAETPVPPSIPLFIFSLSSLVSSCLVFVLVVVALSTFSLLFLLPPFARPSSARPGECGIGGSEE